MARQRLAVLLAAAAAAQPSGLLVSFKRVPALSVPLAPQFTWIVPPSPTVADAAQTAYRIVVAAAFGSNATIWDSGRVASNASVGVPFGGAALRGGRAFTACVSTWLSDGAPPTTSPPALFTTALDPGGWAPGAAFLWAGNGTAGTFALLRRELRLSDFGGGGAPLALALLHASATPGDDTVLTGYTAFVAGALVGVGPGRGEARVWGGDGVFRGLPYDTHDVTAALRAAGAEGGAPFVLAAAGVGAAARGVLLQLDVHFADGSVASVATDGNFSAFDADAWLGPTDPARPLQTAYHPKLEFTDARLEPVGWRDVGFAGVWPPAAVTLAVNSTAATAAFVEKMVGAVVVVPAASTAPARIVEINSTFGLVDFQREFQGGLVLSCAAGAAGARVTLTSGERHDNGTVLSTWGYSFTWTLRDGPQTIEQLQYMLFRYVNVAIDSSGAAAPLALSDLSLSAWRVAAPWDESESAFSSTNATLDAVWAQSRYTLSAGVADTYTDSNTRERRVYEADGLIAAGSRLLVQRDVAWARHSHTYVMYRPTWPVEWLQMTPQLALLDFWATGVPDFAVAYLAQLRANTNVALVDATGLVNTTTGRHIVDWDPWPTHAQFHQSSHLSVTSFWALAGLRSLARLASAAGLGAAAAELAAQASALGAAAEARMFNASALLYCDGICEDAKVGGFASPLSSAFALATGALDAAPAAARAAAWARVAGHGLEGYGSYGAFMFIHALIAAGDDGDDGTALLSALTKCDDESWCAEMRVLGATMTRESWVDPTATYSHPWSTSPIAGIVNGIAGLKQTAPAWAAFTIAPRLGGLAAANLTISTLRGAIAVEANATHTAARVPCGARAALCARHGVAAGGAAALAAGRRLVLDGARVARARTHAGALHLCVEVGCGAGGARRVVTVM